MAEIAHTISRTAEGHRLVTWANVTENDTFEAFSSDKNIKSAQLQIGGTFGGATAVVNGSNDDSVYAGLNDQFGNAISVTAAAFKEISERPLYIQPSASGGTGQSLTLKLLLRM